MGTLALEDNIDGFQNIAIGTGALSGTTDGDYNVAMGNGSLGFNQTGVANTGVGFGAGTSNIVGSNNTFLGARSNVSVNNLSSATAIGSNALVTNSNAMVLGSINGINGATANTNVGIGTTNPLTTLDVNGGIRTRYSGTNIQNVNPGLNIIPIPVNPPLPAGWDFTNTLVLVSIVDGTTGTIYQTKLVATNQINIDMNANFGGLTRFNYIIFKL